MDKYPTLKAPSTEASGEPLTFSMLESAMRKLADPERHRQEAEYRERLTDELNLRAKTYWAKLHGKTVDELTDGDMAELNEAFFRAWLKYKGITEREGK